MPILFLWVKCSFCDVLKDLVYVWIWSIVCCIQNVETIFNCLDAREQTPISYLASKKKKKIHNSFQRISLGSQAKKPSLTQVQRRALDSLGCSQDLKQYMTAKICMKTKPKKAKVGRNCKENLGQDFLRSGQLSGESIHCWEAEVELANNVKVIQFC